MYDTRRKIRSHFKTSDYFPFAVIVPFFKRWKHTFYHTKNLWHVFKIVKNIKFTHRFKSARHVMKISNIVPESKIGFKPASPVANDVTSRQLSKLDTSELSLTLRTPSSHPHIQLITKS